ncbi:MAG TPA: response regulator, partial [Streptosporangiaceae bacterium]|nr:response regulator [Streptosporangiaceae bacterium]
DRIQDMAGHILIVDDDVIFRTLAAELLASQGFDVFDEAADGQQALVLVAGRCPDAILLDISLPGGLDGFTLAPSLAAACPDAKIVLISAGIDHVPAEVLEACAANAFLPKQELAVADLSALLVT